MKHLEDMKHLKRKVYIETLGCQMNFSDSEIMLGLLEKEGFEPTKAKAEADLMIINTCQIRGSAESKAYSYLGRWHQFKQKNPNVKIAMAGCVAQQSKDSVFERMPFIDIVLGTQNIQDLPSLVHKAFAGEKRLLAADKQKERNTFDYLSDITPRRESDISAWVTIIEGCDYFCTYCVVPYTRGRQISRQPDSILKEVRQLGEAGFKEITLLGQTVDSYGRDFTDHQFGQKQYGMAELLYALHEIPGIERIRFMTSHPLDLNDRIIDAVAELPKVMEFIHIPMQAGDDEILKRMRREYTSAQYYALVDKIYERIPNASVTGDYIVGFPGETDAQFQNTLASLKRSGIHMANTAAYSPRQQTPAAIWEARGEEIPEAVKEERLAILNEAIAEQSHRINQTYLGKTVELLVEGVSKRNPNRLMGRTRTNKVVNFDTPLLNKADDLVGQLVQVKINEAYPFSFVAEQVFENGTVCPTPAVVSLPIGL
ncbi:MAG: tRNA (N6-isopentenyl adenosine(37)-C2)-methylthiotransferase MiaB [Vampirovibrionales bacterium]|nr:tRNA (N6-isopentenyl adenosine(37)-C2)-methylthiotransferase MiaB [Vampirovibrionales bacterium]